MRLRSRLTYANVMSSIAVLLALGGTSYAAATITGKNVKNSSLTGTDIKNSSLTSSDVKDKSLLGKDFKAGQLPAGPQGPQGQKGQDGANGKDGAPGTSVFASSIPPGQTVTGAWALQGNSHVETAASLPVPAPAPITIDDVHMAPGTFSHSPDPACTGSLDQPTAPRGKACVYVTPYAENVASGGVATSPLFGDPAGQDRFGFLISTGPDAAGHTAEAYGTWAYTAP